MFIARKYKWSLFQVVVSLITKLLYRGLYKRFTMFVSLAILSLFLLSSSDHNMEYEKWRSMKSKRVEYFLQ